MIRWRVKCINWDKPDAPKAVAYRMHWGEIASEEYCATWAEALAHANNGGHRLPRATPRRVVEEIAERMRVGINPREIPPAFIKPPSEKLHSVADPNDTSGECVLD